MQYGELDVIAGDSLGNIHVFWIETEEILASFAAHDSSVTSLQVDATKCVSSGLDMVIALSDVIQGVVLHKLRGHSAPILAVAFDRKQILSASSDGEIRYWPWETSSRDHKNKERKHRQRNSGVTKNVRRYHP